MYKLEKTSLKKKLNNTIYLDGYHLPSRNKKFKIGDTNVRDITIMKKDLAHPFVIKIVSRKYERLIGELMDLLVSDDDSGTSIMEIMNMIEKFKQEIKNKYRKYLKRKELEEMSKKLKFIRDEALKKQIMYNSIYMSSKTSTRGR